MQRTLAVFFILLIFIADCLTPSNLLVSLLYFLPLVFWHFTFQRGTWLVALTVSALTLLSPLVGAPPSNGVPHWIFWTNRSLSALVTLLVATLLDRLKITIEQREKEANAVKAREVFLALLAHELRNPLSPLQYGVEMLQQTNGNITPQLIAIMSRQLSHLIRLIDDLLELSRIRGGKIVLQLNELDIGDLLSSALETEKEDIERKKQNVTLNIKATRKMVGDEVRLHQVFINLICNASKFTPPGGSIDIDVHEQGQDVIFSVKDSGKGIPPDMLSKIFEMFEQAENRGEVGGLGIGLALVKEIIELHGGTIAAASEGEGMGSTFTLTLPRRQPHQTQGRS